MDLIEAVDVVDRIYELYKRAQAGVSVLPDIKKDLKEIGANFGYGGGIILKKSDTSTLSPLDQKKVAFLKRFKNVDHIAAYLEKVAKNNDPMNDLSINRRLKNTKKCRNHYFNYDIWENSSELNDRHCLNNVTPLLDIYKGNDINNRVGNIITIDSIHLKLTLASWNAIHWDQEARAPENLKTVRISVILDINVVPWTYWDPVNSKVLGVRDIYDTELPWAFKKVEYEKRFLTLYEETLLFQPHMPNIAITSGDWAYIINKYIKVNFQSLFNEVTPETAWDCIKNAVYLVVTTNGKRDIIEDAIESRINITGYARIRFHEPTYRDYEYND